MTERDLLVGRGSFNVLMLILVSGFPVEIGVIEYLFINSEELHDLSVRNPITTIGLEVLNHVSF